MNNKLEKVMIFLAVTLPLFIIASLIFVLGPILNVEKPQYITILHTNDVHGRLQPHKYRKLKGLVGGMAKRAALIKKLESTTENILTVDAGDFAQGTLFFNLFNGTPDVELMHDAGYDVATLGNHEFDKGLTMTKAIIKQAKFPFVNANIKFADEEMQNLVKPYVIKNYDGFKVAVIGLITKNLKVLVNKLDRVEILDPVEATRKIVADINNKVDMIVVLSHEGYLADKKLALAVPEIDVIIGGHSHTLLKQPNVFNEKVDKTLIVQDGEFGVNLGKLSVKMLNKEVQDYYYELIPIDYKIKPDNEIKTKVSKLAEAIDKYKTTIVGKLSHPIGATEGSIRTSLLKTGGLVTEAIKHRFPDVDIVLQNSGGVRLARKIEAGEITLADVIELYPFENTIVVLEIKGSELKSILETSSRLYPRANGGFLQSIGLEYNLNPDNQPQKLSDNGLKILKEGNRVSDIKVNGKPVEEEKNYKIALNNYIYGGGNGYSQFKKATNAVDTGILVQELIVSYIKETSPVSVEIKDKINFITTSK